MAELPQEDSYLINTFRSTTWNPDETSKALDESGNQTYCRWWWSKSTIVDDKIYLDGGHIYFQGKEKNSLPRGFSIEPNNKLVALDLTRKVSFSNYDLTSLDTPSRRPPTQRSNIFHGKDGNIYTPGGGYVMANSTADNYVAPPRTNTPSNKVWKYDSKKEEWTETTFKGDSFLNLVGQAGAQAPNAGYSLHGFRNFETEGDLKSEKGVIAQTGMLKFDFEDMSVKNITTPFSPRAFASMEYVPGVGREGILVVIGGVELEANKFVDMDDGEEPDMSKIHVFDIAEEEWYTQEATAADKDSGLPGPISNACTSLASAPDGSSHNIHLISGTSTSDAWILSLPSFRWIPASSTRTSTSSPSIGQQCVSKGKFIFVTGGQQLPPTREETCQEFFQIFEMSSLTFTNSYDPANTAYTLPSTLSSQIKDKTEPDAGWSSPSLQQLFAVSSSDDVPPPPPPAGTEDPERNKLATPVITGASIGALAGLLLLTLGMYLLVRRRRRARAAREGLVGLGSGDPSRSPSASAFHTPNKGGFAVYTGEIGTPGGPPPGIVTGQPVGPGQVRRMYPPPPHNGAVNGASNGNGEKGSWAEGPQVPGRVVVRRAAGSEGDGREIYEMSRVEGMERGRTMAR